MEIPIDIGRKLKKEGNINLIAGKINTKHKNKVQGQELFSNDYKRSFQKQNYNISPVFMQSSMLVLLYWDIFDLTFSTVTHVWIFCSTFFHTFTFITEVFLITTVTTTHCLLEKIKERNILNSLSQLFQKIVFLNFWKLLKQLLSSRLRFYKKWDLF